jgi:UDP-glucose 4-epimerase
MRFGHCLLVLTRYTKIRDTVVITGGAGYVGSHCAKALAAAGHEGVVFDSLLFGHRGNVRWGDFISSSRSAQTAIQVHGFLSHLHFLMVTMSQKSSIPQAVKSVSQALMSDSWMP